MLDQVLLFSELKLPAGQRLPQLPEKRFQNGNKKSGDEMMQELESYISALLKIPLVSRMIFTRLFFSFDYYTDLEETGASSVA